ncbi:MAG: phage tail tape measure protein, partial [Actinobacteria bacterium]|nr:phage tail tape measure protein [Actinomycetota bacterium]
MADIESNIKVNIDTSDALAQLKLLQQQISAFQQAMRNAGAQNAAAAAAMQQNLVTSINATGKFQANIKTIKTSAESFTEALEKNKMSIGEYFRYAGGASKTFGKLFKSEFATIQQVAIERVKEVQTQYIKLGRDASGAMKAISVKPLALDMNNLATKTQIAAQRQQLFNQLMKQGSTQLLNFGKNTQWAGRQLMVGFTIPLTMMGSAAAKAYMQIEFTQYGLAVAETMDMAAQAAAMGKTGSDLLAQINQSAKLAVLGGVDQQKALETTISLTNAFGVSAQDLGKNIDFLNAVENQTTLSIEDLTIAIPKAAPVVKQLGGDVKDLAFFLTAMKEGGINASEGANAIKSGLASLINPSQKASQFLQSFGINVKGIV